MSDILETFWQQFAIETEEHFELIEPLLVAADQQSPEGVDIAQLFRSVHSIKGLARAMDLRGMEAVSHHAENLLGLVREGRLVLAGEPVALLLEALDVLKGLQASAIATRTDSPAPDELLQRLEAVFVAIYGAVDTVPVVPDTTPLHEDLEMLGLFAEMLEAQAPALIQALIQEGRDGSGVAAREAAEGLAHAAGVMQFENVAELCERLAASEALARPLADPAPRRAALDDLRRVVAILAELERDLGRSGGAARLELAIAEAALPEIGESYRNARMDIERFQDGVRSGVPDDLVIADAAQSFRDLHDVLLITGRLALADLFLLFEDALRRAVEGEALPLGELAGLAAAALDQAGQAARLDGVIDDGEVEGLIGRLRTAMLVGSLAEGDPLADLAITPDLRRRLSPEQVAEVASALSRGQHVLEVTADIERDPVFAQQFLGWLQISARPINNRNLVIDGVNWFHFLVTTADDLAATSAVLATFDPERRQFIVADTRIADAAPVRRGGGVTVERSSAASQAQSRQTNIMRVPGETIDRFLARIGEFALASGRLSHAIENDQVLSATQGLALVAEGLRTGTLDPARAAEDIRAFLADLGEERRRAREADEQLHGSLRQLQDSAIELRVVPIDTVFNRFPRLVRDMAQAQGKQIALELRGQEVRIDKGMVEMLLDPLMHMVRNAIDHGIETPEERRRKGKPDSARLLLDAVQRGNRVIIEVADDGRGLDDDRIRDKAVRLGLVSAQEAARLAGRELWGFIFAPGFSTATQVTETSGRGVGMDVVSNNVNRLGGSIKVESRPGAGTRFILELPLSVAVQDVLLVEVLGQTLAIPDRYVAEVYAAAPGEIQRVNGRRALLLRGDVVPVFSLAGLLGRGGRGRDGQGGEGQGSAIETGDGSLVVLSDSQRAMAVRVDRLLRRHELFVKDIHPKLAAIPGIGGASILGDGGVVLILDGDDLFKLAERDPGVAAHAEEAL